MLAAPAGAWAASEPATEDGPGYRLLDSLVLLLDAAGRSGGEGGGALNDGLLKLARELQSAGDAKQVDDLFAVRFSRLLSAIRQAALSDPALLYWPMYRYEMADFIEERTGRPPDWEKILFAVRDHGGSGVGMANVAEAAMAAVVSLHIHLQTASRREEILQGYFRKIQQANPGRGSEGRTCGRQVTGASAVRVCPLRAMTMRHVPRPTPQGAHPCRDSSAPVAPPI